MLDTDTILMKRALDLAKRGAGLVSPNPMVGALLVHDGRIVGEGYHRYDRLKHAESYAIEMAGKLARGSTLYCSLEPCCHHGRTPPCTDALIQAKIGRARIAIKDPDPRVNGQGIQQLRDANIEVEVGFLEGQAMRINESYFKFITTGTPFVHGIVEYTTDPSVRSIDWKPSAEFLRGAAEYDAVMIGNLPELNRLVVENSVRRERHRLFVVAAANSEPAMIQALHSEVEGDYQVVEFDPHAETDSSRKVVSLNEGVAHGFRSPLNLLLSTLSRIQVTSVLILPGVFDSTDPVNFEQFDKVTITIPGLDRKANVGAKWSFGDIECDIDEVTVTEAGGYTELTGYPSLRGAA